MSWTFRGTPPYINTQGRRLGLSPVLVDRARHNEEIKKAGIILAQLCEGYHRAPKSAEGIPQLDHGQIARVQATLQECERFAERLHVVAAAIADMIDEAYAVHGLEAPERAMKVWCAYDDPEPEPAVNGAAPVPLKVKAKAIG